MAIDDLICVGNLGYLVVIDQTIEGSILRAYFDGRLYLSRGYGEPVELIEETRYTNESKREAA